MKITKVSKILAFVKSLGRPAKYSEIQCFIVEMNGRDYDHFDLEYDYNYRTRTTLMKYKRVNRGYYCSSNIWSKHLRKEKDGWVLKSI